MRDLRAAGAPTYVPGSRAYLVVLADDDAAAFAEVSDPALAPGLADGLLALHQKCPHLGCRVPYCESSGWFECACHGSMFTQTGEHRDGPGPRGMDAFPVLVDGDAVTIDTRTTVTGAPVGTVVVEQLPAGPHCVGGIEH
jgi:cytochrome b6-f complex iron-sulfur subunit